MTALKPELIARLSAALRDLDARIANAGARLDDKNADRELRTWLDGRDAPLEWAAPYPEVTPDEWFFISTLYGRMTLDAQREHIRKFFPTLFARGPAGHQKLPSRSGRLRWPARSLDASAPVQDGSDPSGAQPGDGRLRATPGVPGGAGDAR